MLVTPNPGKIMEALYSVYAYEHGLEVESFEMIEKEKKDAV